MSGRHKISLHKGSLIGLQNHYENAYDGPNGKTKVALASSADTPFAEEIGRAALKMLEVVPGYTVWDLLMRDWDGKDVNQIGRQPPLSSSKFLKKKIFVYLEGCTWSFHLLTHFSFYTLQIRLSHIFHF